MPAGGHASGDSVVGVIMAFTVLASIATVTRLITRIGIVHNSGLDDLVIAIACILTIALTATMCMQVKYGMGRHASTLTANDGTQSLIWFWASVWIYYLALCCAKLSIILQYLRIFPEKRFRKWCFTLMAVIVLWTFWAFFSALFACWPIQHFWNQTIPGTCLNRLAVWFSNAAVNIATDIATAILPLPVLNSLNLPKRQRYILMLVFGMGGVVCIISILRLSALYAVSVSTDISWDNPLAAVWSSTEVNVGIICSCLPTLKGCVVRFFPSLFTTAGSKHATPVFELSGRGQRTKNECHISANREHHHYYDEKRNGKFKKLGRLSEHYDGKDLEEGRSDRSTSTDRSSPPSGIPGIHVTTVVEQEEEREYDHLGVRHESESVRNLVTRPTKPFEGA